MTGKKYRSISPNDLSRHNPITGQILRINSTSVHD